MTKVLSAPLLADSKLSEQIALERRSRSDGAIRYRQRRQYAEDRGRAASLVPAEAYIRHWMAAMILAVRQHKRSCMRGENGRANAVLTPFFAGLDARDVAYITMSVAINETIREPQGVPFPRLAKILGREIVAEFSYRQGLREHPDEIAALNRRIVELSGRHVVWWAKNKVGMPREWYTTKVYVQVGVPLLWHLLNSASRTDYENPKPAFEVVLRPIVSPRGKLMDTKVFRMHDRTRDIIDEAHRSRQHIRPVNRFMLCKPFPWGPGRHGGYVTYRHAFIGRCSDAHAAFLKRFDLSPIYDRLNALDDVPHRINGPVFEHIKGVWNGGGGMLSVPRVVNLPLPPRPEGFDHDAPHGKQWAKVDPEERRAWAKKYGPIVRENKELKPARTLFLSKMTEAEDFLGKSFYIPHKLDARGRCYPVPGMLNYQQEDLSRSMFEFDYAGKQTERGVRWLKVAAANAAGQDKKSFDERVEWADTNREALMEAARSPATADIVHEADSPWQLVAAAIALRDPEGAGMRLPVRMDGSCNGLQWYAALGRDADAARATNLTDSPRPNRIYRDVAGTVRSIMETDDNPYAARLLPYMTDKPCKGPVMTLQYGVTMSGMMDQVGEMVREILYPGVPDEDLERQQWSDAGKATAYLVRLIQRATLSLCPNSIALMKWIRNYAAIVATETGRHVTWHSPCGLPVFQDYELEKMSSFKTIAGQVRLYRSTGRIAIGKQKKGAAPNVIHSFDKAHMMNTSLSLYNEGIPFVGIHDSYGTVAPAVDRMHEVLRREFVRIIEGEPLEAVREWGIREYKVDIPELPAKGTFDIREVLGATYFFN